MNKLLPYTVVLLAALLACAAAYAQHAPLIERMADGSSPPAPVAQTLAAPSPASAPVPSYPARSRDTSARPEIGDTTRALLRLQADGSQAGAALPMLGEAASRSYQRYLGSFDHPIPEFFEAALPDSKQGGSSR